MAVQETPASEVDLEAAASGRDGLHQTPARIGVERAIADSHIRELWTCLKLDERLKTYARSVEVSKEDSRTTRQLLDELAGYLIGFALLGMTLGVFTGWSSSPVVGTVLPIIFGVLSATGGFALTQAQLTRARASIIGLSLGLFSIACVAGTVLGISVRTGASVFSLIPTLASSSIPELHRLSAEQSLVALSFRDRLVKLGVQSSTQDALLQTLTAELSQVTHPDFRELESTFEQAGASLKKTAEFPQLDAEAVKLLHSDLALLRLYQTEIGTWNPYNADLAAAGYYQSRTQDLADTIKNMALELTTADQLRGTDAGDALWKCFSLLSQAAALSAHKAQKDLSKLLGAAEGADGLKSSAGTAQRAPASQ